MSRRMLSTMAYQSIKEKISTMPSGSYLSVRQCASELDMSYTPVREAFLQLQKEGVLRQVPNVGFFIQTVDLTDLFQMFQVRECLEPFALSKVFGKFTPEHIQRMRHLCHKEEEARAAGDGYRYSELDAQFHRVPLELLGNKQLLSLYDNTRAQYQIVSGRLLLLIDSEIQEEHLAFVQAVEQQDQEAAKRILLAHIQELKQRFIQNYITSDVE